MWNLYLGEHVSCRGVVMRRGLRWKRRGFEVKEEELGVG